MKGIVSWFRRLFHPEPRIDTATIMAACADRVANEDALFDEYVALQPTGAAFDVDACAAWVDQQMHARGHLDWMKARGMLP